MATQPPTVFIAGATGYTGQALVLECRQRGMETIAHARAKSRRLSALAGECERVGARLDTTAWELHAMSEQLAHLAPSIVFAALGTTRARGREEPDATYEAVDYGLTMLLLEACRACEPRPRFVYLSAMGAKPAAMSQYMRVRARVEGALAESGMAHTIVRPGMISGDDRWEDRRGERAAARVSDGLLTLAGAMGMGRLRDRYRSVDATTLARAMVSAACDPMSDADTLGTLDIQRLATTAR